MANDGRTGSTRYALKLYQVMTRTEANNIKDWFEVGLKIQLEEGKIDDNEANRLRAKLAKDIEKLLNH